MSLPININTLISRNTVEWERKEFKESWNPETIVRSLCAFANDINNWGGGYIIIGIEEKGGKPILPPKGINENKIDKIQKEIIELCNKLQPTYFPVIEPVIYKDVHIIILWCPGGDNRPYSAPTTLGKKFQRAKYVRRGSSTVKANEDEIRQLHELTAKIPFDDRINHNASIQDFSLALIRDYLFTVKSKLYDEMSNLDIEQIANHMLIIKGSSEYLKPTNIGLLMFSENPQKYFESAYIDCAIYEDDAGTKYNQKIFKGPIHKQLKSALKYIKDNIIIETVQKIKGEEEALRYFNYPFEAVEETLVNAVYHRSYQLSNQVEVHVRTDMIEIVSYPGALPPINNETLQKKRITARNYRNRRIGDFFKELKLAENKGTGIPTIRQAMQKNGSPKPLFEMDEDKTYLLTKLRIHPKSYKISKEIELLEYCRTGRTRKEILVDKLNLSNQTSNFNRYIEPLIENGYLEFILPKKTTSKKQQYKTTKKGTMYILENMLNKTINKIKKTD